MYNDYIKYFYTFFGRTIPLYNRILISSNFVMMKNMLIGKQIRTILIGQLFVMLTGLFFLLSISKMGYRQHFKV